MIEEEKKEPHICKLSPVPGIWTLMKITPAHKGYKVLSDATIPMRAFLCGECARVRIYSENIMRKNLEELSKPSPELTKKTE